MNKFWVVFSHTYMSKLKSKPFIISTVITLLFIFAIANIQSIIEFFASDEGDRIAVIDYSEQLFDPLQQSTQEVDENLELVPFSASEEDGRVAVNEEEFDALLIMELTEEQ